MTTRRPRAAKSGAAAIEALLDMTSKRKGPAVKEHPSSLSGTKNPSSDDIKPAIDASKTSTAAPTTRRRLRSQVTEKPNEKQTSENTIVEDEPTKLRSKRTKVSKEAPTAVKPTAVSSSKLLTWEKKFWADGLSYVVGVDEAGRGPLAGPVVVAGCAIDEIAPDIDSTVIDDSKVLTEEMREHIYEMLIKSKHVHYAIEVVEHPEIDEKNILRATLAGMDRVVAALATANKCDAVLVDGPFKPPQAAAKFSLSDRVHAIKGGDASVRAIGAASVLAKVTRDRIMKEYHEKFPVYGFDKHKGYPVPQHVAALMKHGPCEIHRRSYAPVQKAIMALAVLKKSI